MNQLKEKIEITTQKKRILVRLKPSTREKLQALQELTGKSISRIVDVILEEAYAEIFPRKERSMKGSDEALTGNLTGSS